MTARYPLLAILTTAVLVLVTGTRAAPVVAKKLPVEDLFFEVAIADLARAADLFKPVYERTATVDGWVSLEVSPLLAYEAKATVEQLLDSGTLKRYVPPLVALRNFHVNRPHLVHYQIPSDASAAV